MATNKRDMSKVVAVGEMEGQTIEVIEAISGDNARYVWRSVKDGQITHKSYEMVDSIPGAIDMAVKHFYPDVEPVHVTEPEQKDFEAISMLLYCGGLNQELETLAEVITMHNDFQVALETLAKGRAKARKDFEYALSALKATHGPMHNGVIDLASLAQVFDAQCEVVMLITERNVTTLQSFMQEFLK